MKGDREKALEAGATDYVTKPVDSERLLAVSTTGSRRLATRATRGTRDGLDTRTRLACCSSTTRRRTRRPRAVLSRSGSSSSRHARAGRPSRSRAEGSFAVAISTFRCRRWMASRPRRGSGRPRQAGAPDNLLHGHPSRRGLCAAGLRARRRRRLTKPFDPDVLRARVKAFADLFRQREELRAHDVELRTRERDEAIRRLVAFERISSAALEEGGLTSLLPKLLGVFLEAADSADSATIFLREGELLRVRASVGRTPEKVGRTVPSAPAWRGHRGHRRALSSERRSAAGPAFAASSAFP